MTGEYENVVVIGLGLAAAEAVKALIPKLPADHRIVAVAENEGYWPIASLRAAVVPVSSSAAPALYEMADSELTCSRAGVGGQARRVCRSADSSRIPTRVAQGHECGRAKRT